MDLAEIFMVVSLPQVVIGSAFGFWITVVAVAIWGRSLLNIVLSPGKHNGKY